MTFILLGIFCIGLPVLLIVVGLIWLWAGLSLAGKLFGFGS